MMEGTRSSRCLSGGVALALLIGLSSTSLAQTKPPVDDRRPSPNYTASNSRTIRTIVIHTVQGSYLGCLSWFANPASRVSAHYTVAKDGRLGQSVDDHNIGWHAGNYAVNRESIGIEHEGFVDDPNNYTQAMLEKSAALTRWLCDTYGIPIDRQHIIGHIEVPGATHTDPGPHFPWNYYIALVAAGGSSSTPTPPPAPPTNSVRAVEVTARTLNVRDGVWGSRLGHVHRGRRLVVIGEDRGWLEIWYHGRKAWFHGGYTQPYSRGSAEEVTSSALNVRTGPSTGYRRVGRVYRGQTYVRDTTSGAWRKIHFGHDLRWFHGGHSQTVPVR